MSIHAIWGPPQSGKTTLAIDLAYALSHNDLSVCLVSPELYSELSARMKINILEEKSLISACNARESLKQVVHKVDDLLYVLAVPSYNDAFGEEIGIEDAKKLLRQARTLFDVVLVDCPSHAGSVLAARALNMADRVVFLSGCRSSSYLWHKSFHRATETVKERVLPVCIELSKDFNYRTLNEMLHVTPEIWLPYIKDAETQLLERSTLYKIGGRAGKIYTNSLELLCEKLEGDRDL